MESWKHLSSSKALAYWIKYEPEETGASLIRHLLTGKKMKAKIPGRCGILGDDFFMPPHCLINFEI